MDADRPLNNLLRTLRNEDYALIAAHLEGGSRSSQELLYNQGDDVETVYFPCAASLVSFVISGEDGREVEATLVGREGAVGGIVSLGHLPAYSRMVVKFG